jgi:Uma2 family endonuclease
MISIDLTVRRIEFDTDAVHPALRLLVQLPRRPLTLDDVGQLAADDESHRYELADGNLLIRPPADVEHAALITRLGAWLIAGGYADRVLDRPGLRITEPTSGRSPDILVLRAPVAATGTAGWFDPADAALVIEVVSPGSETLDRVTKPGEYARAGIPQFWRVERDGPATVHLYRRGVDERGRAAYIGHRAMLLEDLLAGTPPAL